MTKKTFTSPSNWIRLCSERNEFTFYFISRDWKVLSCLDNSIGQQWLKEFGFHSDVSICDGLRIGHEVWGNRNEMLDATENLLGYLQAHENVLIYDYSVKMVPGCNGEPFRDFGGRGGAGLAIGDKPFGLSIGPGQCFLDESTLSPSKIIIDLRTLNTYEFDGLFGHFELKIQRRKKELVLLNALPRLSNFLRLEKAAKISIFNHHQ